MGIKGTSGLLWGELHPLSRSTRTTHTNKRTAIVLAATKTVFAPGSGMMWTFDEKNLGKRPPPFPHTPQKNLGSRVCVDREEHIFCGVIREFFFWISRIWPGRVPSRIQEEKNSLIRKLKKSRNSEYIRKPCSKVEEEEEEETEEGEEEELPPREPSFWSWPPSSLLSCISIDWLSSVNPLPCSLLLSCGALPQTKNTIWSEFHWGRDGERNRSYRSPHSCRWKWSPSCCERPSL